jgi:hypothetical protein
MYTINNLKNIRFDHFSGFKYLIILTESSSVNILSKGQTYFRGLMGGGGGGREGKKR